MFTANLPRAISPPIPRTVVVLLNKHPYYVLVVSAFTASGGNKEERLAASLG
jgi:hypothetical protein